MSPGGYLEVVRVFEQTPETRMGLNGASQRRYLELVQVLIECDTDTFRDNDNQAPLDWAARAQAGYPEVARVIMAQTRTPVTKIRRIHCIWYHNLERILWCHGIVRSWSEGR